MTRKKKYNISLTDEQVKQLKSIIHKKETSRTIKCRCQILLDLDNAHGKVFTYEQSAKSNGVCRATIANTVKQYAGEGFDSVISLRRSINSDQARRKLDGRSEARIIELACGPAPKGHVRWTLRLLEEKARILLEAPVGKDAIGRALKKTNSGPTAAPTGASLQKRMPSL